MLGAAQLPKKREQESLQIPLADTHVNVVVQKEKKPSEDRDMSLPSSAQIGDEVSL